MRLAEIAGKTFGRLLVVKVVGRAPSGDSLWLARCSCGAEVVRTASNITRVVSRRPSGAACRKCSYESVGDKLSTHGATRKGRKERLYGIWAGMVKRCENKNAHAYELYGGKGIRVCDEWRSYPGFRAWAMSNGYTDDLTIDRVNPNWHYEPSNCEWVTASENSRRVRGNYWRSMTCNA